MTEFAARVEQAILAQRLFEPGESILVGASGGLDSTVLLHVLNRLSEPHGWRLVAAHFNHQLRGRSSDLDQAFVRRLARRLGLRCAVGSEDVGAFAARHGLSVEMAARQLRHQFLARTAARLKIRTIALAHHADDQVELFFLRVLRGAGPEGLAAMAPCSPSPADRRIQLARPLLGFEREELCEYATSHRLAFREDESNQQTTFLRNRVRHELIPLLRTHYQPGLNRTVLRLLEILRAESDLVDQITQETLKGSQASLTKLPAALQRRWIREGCYRLGIVPDFDLVERLRTEPGKRVLVKPDETVWLDREGRVQRESLQTENALKGARRVPLGTGRGRLQFHRVHISWKVTDGTRSLERLRQAAIGCEYFDADKVGRWVQLRHWEPGDRFRPIGACGSSKLQDLFTNHKVPRAERAQRVVAAAQDGTIFWVEGLRMSEGHKVGTETRRILEWRWKRKPQAHGNLK